MAEVKIELCVSHSCCHKGIFTLSDLTGPYDATINPYGWGAGNIELSEVTSSGLTVTSPSGAVYGPFDILASLPSLDGGTTIITPESPATATTGTPPSISTQTLSVNSVQVSDPFTNAFGDSDAFIAFKIQAAIDSYGSGFTIVYSGGFYVLTAPAGSGDGYNGLYAMSGTLPSVPWFLTFANNGVNEVSVTQTNSLEIDVTNILSNNVGEAYVDGYWVFDWVVGGEYGGVPTVFNSRCVKQELVLCDVQCCVDKLMANTDPSCGCSKTANKKSINALLTIEGIKARDCKKEREGVKSLLVKLQDICNNNCKDC